MTTAATLRTSSLQDIADAIAQMHEKARYRRLLLFVETCEAETLTDRVYSPNVLTIATSKLGASLVLSTVISVLTLACGSGCMCGALPCYAEKRGQLLAGSMKHTYPVHSRQRHEVEKLHALLCPGVCYDWCRSSSLRASVTKYLAEDAANNTSHCCAGEKSYSHHTDMDVGLTVTDRVTYHGLQWFNRVGVTSNATVQDFLDYVGCALRQNSWLNG
jgi:glycosylphosphatidylinositol transamidase (GPIT) subunit GPI8